MTPGPAPTPMSLVSSSPPTHTHTLQGRWHVAISQLFLHFSRTPPRTVRSCGRSICLLGADVRRSPSPTSSPGPVPFPSTSPPGLLGFPLPHPSGAQAPLRVLHGALALLLRRLPALPTPSSPWYHDSHPRFSPSPRLPSTTAGPRAPHPSGLPHPVPRGLPSVCVTSVSSTAE